jgi:hypothetical protein
MSVEIKFLSIWKFGEQKYIAVRSANGIEMCPFDAGNQTVNLFDTKPASEVERPGWEYVCHANELPSRVNRS